MPHVGDDKKSEGAGEYYWWFGTINVPSWAPDSHHLAFVSYQMQPVEDEGKK